MQYTERMFRPPAEAESLIFQVALGCPHNTCSFCGMYKGQRFTLKDEATVLADIDYAALHELWVLDRATGTETARSVLGVKGPSSSASSRSGGAPSSTPRLSIAAR